jgi:hypothetical protein
VLVIELEPSDCSANPLPLEPHSQSLRVILYNIFSFLVLIVTRPKRSDMEFSFCDIMCEHSKSFSFFNISDF